LLNEKGVSFSEVDVLAQPERKAEMVKRANGGRTVPQIFIGDTHVGGCDDLYALERAGKLDAVLAA
jgi:glutaredoxin 3